MAYAIGVEGRQHFVIARIGKRNLGCEGLPTVIGEMEFRCGRKLSLMPGKIVVQILSIGLADAERLSKGDQNPRNACRVSHCGLIVWPSTIAVEFKVGISILAACPGGMIANFIAYLFNASVALAISLPVINSFIALLSIPWHH